MNSKLPPTGKSSGNHSGGKNVELNPEKKPQWTGILGGLWGETEKTKTKRAKRDWGPGQSSTERKRVNRHEQITFTSKSHRQTLEIKKKIKQKHPDYKKKKKRRRRKKRKKK